MDLVHQSRTSLPFTFRDYLNAVADDHFDRFLAKKNSAFVLFALQSRIRNQPPPPPHHGRNPRSVEEIFFSMDPYMISVTCVIFVVLTTVKFSKNIPI